MGGVLREDRAQRLAAGHLHAIDDAELELRAEVRAFLQAELDATRIVPRLGHAEYDAEFIERVAARGWTA